MGCHSLFHPAVTLTQSLCDLPPGVTRDLAPLIRGLRVQLPLSGKLRSPLNAAQRLTEQEALNKVFP